MKLIPAIYISYSCNNTRYYVSDPTPTYNSNLSTCEEDERGALRTNQKSKRQVIILFCLRKNNVLKASSYA